MNQIDMLIKMKKSQNTDDLLTMFDEIVKYEKLAKTPAFVDIKASAPVQKKLPLLTKVVNNDLYSLALLQIAFHVITHVGGELPGILPTVLEEVSTRNAQRIQILEQTVIKINYRDLNRYEESLKDLVLLTLVDNERKKDRSIAIITSEDGGYVVYQGVLHMKEEEEHTTISSLSCHYKKNDNILLQMYHYSVLGNNAYRFATAIFGDITYDIMMPYHNMIWLLQGNEVTHRIQLPMDAVNQFNFIKTDIGQLSDFLLEIITETLIPSAVDDQQNIEGTEQDEEVHA